MPKTLANGVEVSEKKWIEPWIGIDLDRTIAVYKEFINPMHIGEPIPEMVDRVKKLLTEGKYKVKIFTARVSDLEQAKEAIPAIQEWCLKHIGQVLEITCMKDFGCIEVWDDRAKQVDPNTGIFSSKIYYKAGYQAGYTKGYQDRGREDN
jgi:hypothetical protein